MKRMAGALVCVVISMPLGGCRRGNPHGGSADGGGSGEDAARPSGVFMRAYDPAGTGANLRERALTTASVAGPGFGKLGCRPVDDEIYGQILYVADVDYGLRGRHDTVYAVTMNNSVYAYGAKDLAGGPLWEAHYSGPGRTPIPTSDLARTTCGAYRDISQRVGILSTPVIDPVTGTMYLVTRTKEGEQHFQHIHALSIIDGSERRHSPVLIDARAPGSGDGQVNGSIRFDPLRQNQRAGLLLHEGVVYVAWGSHCDEGPYHGWIIGYDAQTLEQRVVFNATPGGSGGGLWMSGHPPVVDEDGDIYVITGNGTADEAGGADRGESFLRLRRQGGTLAIADWFTPFNHRHLDDEDRDLGSAGALLIRGTPLLLGAGKEGKVYALDRRNLGRYRPDGDDQILQSIQVSPIGGHIHGTPVSWSSSLGTYVYIMASEDYLKQYEIKEGKLTLYRTSPISAPIDPGFKPGGYTKPGGSFAISADGAEPATGILWINVPIAKDANQATVPGILRAVDASDVTRELWNSEKDPARDSYGNYAKFNIPTVYDGRVYMPTFSNQFCVYGLR